MKKIKLLVSVILLTAISAFANSQDYDWIQMTQYVSYATNGTTETQRQEFEYDNDGKEIGFKLYLNGALYSQYRNYQYNGRTVTCWMDTYSGSIIQSTCKLQRTFCDRNWIQMTQYVAYATNGTTETQRQEFEYDNDGKEIGFKLYLNGTLYSQYRNYQYNGRTATCWMDTYTGSIIQSTCKLQRTYKEVTNSTEIVNVLANSISIYPSPTKGELIIENGDFKIGNIDIYDNSGKKVLSSTNTTINISQFLAGTYFVKIKTDKGEFTKKIFKE